MRNGHPSPTSLITFSHSFNTTFFKHVGSSIFRFKPVRTQKKVNKKRISYIPTILVPKFDLYYVCFESIRTRTRLDGAGGGGKGKVRKLVEERGKEVLRSIILRI
jgi:hypothetical protein